MYEVLSLHNTYAYKAPIHIGVVPNRIYSFGDKVEDARTGGNHQGERLALGKRVPRHYGPDPRQNRTAGVRGAL